MGGGAVCCVVDCHTCASKCRGLSFHKLPQITKGDTMKNEWRSRLIAIINRCDKFFHPERASICSRHFTEDCFKPHGMGRTLIVGSLPTRYLPAKSIQTPPTVPRKQPVQRSPPPVVERVVYFNLDDVRKHAANLPQPWFLMPSTCPTTMELGLLDGFTLKFKVEIREDLSAAFFVYGMKGLTTSIEKVRLSPFLKSMSEMQLCLGVTDTSVQKLAPLSSAASRFGRHVMPVSVDQALAFQSTVRSKTCQIFLSWESASKSEPNLCNACKDIQRELQAKKERKRIALKTPLKPQTPLRRVPHKKLVEEVKNIRERNRRLIRRIVQTQKRLDSDKASEDHQNRAESVMDTSDIPDHQYAECRGKIYK